MKAVLQFQMFNYTMLLNTLNSNQHCFKKRIATKFSVTVQLYILKWVTKIPSFLAWSSALEMKQPCNPSPCGPNSQCRNINEQAVCSCVSGFMGSPPSCRPECIVSSDCSLNEACSNQKCRDPCPGTCGVGARCQVINHNPICSCPSGLTGDPFIRCQPIRKDIT